MKMEKKSNEISKYYNKAYVFMDILKVFQGHQVFPKDTLKTSILKNNIIYTAIFRVYVLGS